MPAEITCAGGTRVVYLCDAGCHACGGTGDSLRGRRPLLPVPCPFATAVPQADWYYAGRPPSREAWEAVLRSRRAEPAEGRHTDCDARA